jgi:hypothetical protein
MTKLSIVFVRHQEYFASEQIQPLGLMGWVTAVKRYARILAAKGSAEEQHAELATISSFASLLAVMTCAGRDSDRLVSPEACGTLGIRTARFDTLQCLIWRSPF